VPTLSRPIFDVENAFFDATCPDRGLTYVHVGNTRFFLMFLAKGHIKIRGIYGPIKAVAWVIKQELIQNVYNITKKLIKRANTSTSPITDNRSIGTTGLEAFEPPLTAHQFLQK